MLIDLTLLHTLVFDFDGVFTDNKVYLNAEGEEYVRCDRRDGLAFDLMRSAQKRGLFALDVLILSKESNPVVLARAKKLKLSCLQEVDNKLKALETYLNEKRPQDPRPFDGLIYIGNDLNDLAVMRRAKVAVAPNDAHPLIKKHATIVLAQNGGESFVRAFMEKLLRIEDMDIHELERWI